jgi:hypothetical protein
MQDKTRRDETRQDKTRIINRSENSTDTLYKKETEKRKEIGNKV